MVVLIKCVFFWIFFCVDIYGVHVWVSLCASGLISWSTCETSQQLKYTVHQGLDIWEEITYYFCLGENCMIKCVFCAMITLWYDEGTLVIDKSQSKCHLDVNDDDKMAQNFFTADVSGLSWSL